MKTRDTLDFRAERKGVRVVLGVAALAAVLLSLGLALSGSPRSRPALARAGGGTMPHAVAPPKTIVVVVFDELPLTSLMEPGGRLDDSRYPAFAALAQRRPLVPRRDRGARQHGAGRAGDARRALSAAGASGPTSTRTRRTCSRCWRTTTSCTCPRRRPGCARRACACRRPARPRATSRAGSRAASASSCAACGRRRQPALWFKHVLLPHVPWQYYPSGRSYRRFAPEPIPGLNGPLGFGVPWLVKVSYQRHLLQLGMADRLLGELVRRLRSAGLYRDALVVVAADHGIGFRVGLERRTIRPRNVQDLAPVPLIVKLPAGRGGRVIDRHVETIDVLPTILELAGVPVPERVDGRSLFHPVAAQSRRVTVYHRVGTELNTVGGDYAFDAATVARRRDAAVRRKTAWFGSGGGRNPDALYLIGPHAELVGQPVRSMSLLEREEAAESARIDQAEDLREVDLGSRFVPGQITGELPDGRPGGGRQVALALNGKIAATGWTFSLEGSPRESFELMVPESAFRHGPNHARLFEIVAGSGGPALRPLTRASHGSRSSR